MATKVPSGATRVTLGSSFPLWKTAKEQFDLLEKDKRVKSALAEPGAIVYSLTTAPGGSTARPQRKRDDIPAATFMEHLLDVHKAHCAECHPQLQAPHLLTSTPAVTSKFIGPDGNAQTMRRLTNPLVSPIRPASAKVLGFGAGTMSPVSRTANNHPSAHAYGMSWIADKDHREPHEDEDYDSDEEIDRLNVDVYANLKNKSLKDELTGAGCNVDLDALLNTSVEEEVFDVEMDEDSEATSLTSSNCILSAGGNESDEQAKVIAHNCVEQPKCVVFVKKLVDLVEQAYGNTCSNKNCNAKVQCKAVATGTCVTVVRTCSKGHRNDSWDSQPKFKGVFAGNFHLALSILFSGCSFGKVYLMCNFFGLHCISRSTFQRVQRYYASPAVTNYWAGLQSELLSQAKADKPEGIAVAVDARMDSPGYSAQYCTVSFGNVDTGKIIHLEILDVREALGKSVNMEKIGFQRGLKFLSQVLPVGEVVTDAHPQIISLMKSNTAPFNTMKHQIDIWHAGKSLIKRLTKVGNVHKELRPWIPAVRNHFWYSSRECNRNVTTMKSLWLGILHHSVNEHQWTMSIDGQEGRCEHKPAVHNPDKAWLVKGSVAHKALASVVMEKQFLKKFDYFANFRHTGNLESFHNHILMYAPKSTAFGMLGYKTRNILAAIDHCQHFDLPYALDTKGNPQYALHFNRRSKTWVPHKKKVKKTYDYIPGLIVEAFLEYFTDIEPLDMKRENKTDNPLYEICKNRYMQPQPAISEVVERYEELNRFKGGSSSHL